MACSKYDTMCSVGYKKWHILIKTQLDTQLIGELTNTVNAMSRKLSKNLNKNYKNSLIVGRWHNIHTLKYLGL